MAWRAARQQLEKLEGRGAWREALHSPYYDVPLVTRATATLRRLIAEAEASRCPAQLSQLLLSLVNRGFANIGNPHNFAHPAHGAPRAISELVREVPGATLTLTLTPTPTPTPTLTLTLTLTLFLTPPLILPLPLPLPPNPAPYPYANPKQAERGDVHAATRLAAQQYETAGRVAEARRATDSARQKTDTLTFLHPAY